MTTHTTCLHNGCTNSVPPDRLYCAEHRPRRHPFVGATPPDGWPTLTACGCGWDGQVTPGARGQRCPDCGNPLT